MNKLPLFLLILFFANNAFAGRVINFATVDSSSSTTVSSTATIAVAINVTTDGKKKDAVWRATGWRIDNSSGSMECNDHPDLKNPGTATRTFNITAPASDGTYNLYLLAFEKNNCKGKSSSEFQLSNAVIVDSGNGGGNGNSCTTIQVASNGEELRGIGGTSDSNIIAVGHNKPGNFYHYDGSSWVKHTDTSDKQLHDVSVVNNSLAYAVGHDGRIMNYNGTNWSIFSSPSTQYLTSVWATSSSDLWIAGKESTLHHWNGANWINMSSPAGLGSKLELRDIWANSNSVYTLNKTGGLYRYTKSSDKWDTFTACESSYSIDAKSLWSDGLGNVYIAGKNNDNKNATVFLYNEVSDSCSVLASSSTQDKFESIYGNGSVVYAVGKKGLVLENSTGTWGESTQSTDDLKAVWVSNTNTAYYAGKKGYLTTCSGPTFPIPIAKYHMDESSWVNASNEVIDTSGNGHNGTAVNGTSPQNISPAITGNPGSCGYGVFDGSDDYIALSDIPNFQGSFTITAWITGGTIRGGRIFADDDKNQGGYTLSRGDGGSGRLRFFSRNISPVILDTGNVVPNKNKWYFVTAVHDVSTKKRFIYVDGVEEASGTYTGSWGTDSGIASIGAETNASSEGANFASFKGSIDEVQIFESALSQAQIQTIMAETHPCDIPTVVSNFNCINTASNPITGRLFTKLANTPFTVDVVALQDPSTIANGYSNTVTVELVDASSGSCSTHPVLSPEINQSLTFLSATGVETSNNITSTKAYKNLKCRVTDSVTAIAGCSSDAFAIRPDSFTVSSSVNNGASTGSPTKKAGAIFNITAETNTLNYDGTPVINQAQLAAHTGANQTGSLAGSFPAAEPASGNSSGTSFTYSEVGNITLNLGAITDSSFAAIDKASGDCTNNSSNTTDANGKVGCNVANDNSIDIGRFIPDHFEVSIVNQGSFGGSAYACTNFNYIGQDFSYNVNPEIKITAFNGLTPKNITQNYSDGYAKLAISDFNFTPPTSDANQLGVDALNLVNLNWSAIAPALTDNHDGSLTLAFGDDNFKYLQQTNSLVAPFSNTVEFEFTDITDSDSVSSSNLPLSIAPSGALMRFGRLSINNAHGAETVPLSIPTITEYFNGTNWAVNSMDSCTSLNLASNISLSNPASGNNLAGDTAMVIESATSTASLLNSPFSAGQGNLSFSAPGEDNQGYIDIKGALTGFEWLQFDWNSDGSFNGNPTGRASFGLFSGNDKLIFRREVY